MCLCRGYSISQHSRRHSYPPSWTQQQRESHKRLVQEEEEAQMMDDAMAGFYCNVCERMLPEFVDDDYPFSECECEDCEYCGMRTRSDEMADGKCEESRVRASLVSVLRILQCSHGLW